MAATRDWRSYREAWAARLERGTGQDVAAWNARIAEAGLTDEAALRAWLAERGVTGYLRMLLVMERFGYPAFFTATGEELVEAQYADRPQLRPLYEAVVEAAVTLGATVQVRKTYVSLLTPRRTFARVQPSTRTRIYVALRLEDESPGGRLGRSRIHETMPVQFSLSAPEDLDDVALDWLKRAYERNC